MAKFNFGVIKATFNYYLNESDNIQIKEILSNFMGLIKESKLLQTEFQIYKNLDGKYLSNENLAIKYIDENIKLLSSFTKEDMINENVKLFPLIEGLPLKISNTKKSLYEHIHILLFESLKGNNTTDVDKLHESFTFVLEYIKNNKPQISESTSVDYNLVPKEFLIKKAIEKFNSKYNALTEFDQKIFKTIISENKDSKLDLLNNIKTDTLESLSTLLGESIVLDSKINESIEKINSMSYNDESYLNDILSLKEFKENLI